MQIIDETGRAWTLGAKVAAGGEGTVYRLKEAPGCCAKIYHRVPVSARRLAKLKALTRLPAALRASCALPLSLAFGDRSQAPESLLGTVLPFVEGHDIYELYNPQGRRAHFQGVTFEFLVAAARNVAALFHSVHAAGIVIGDVNEQNLKVRSDATVTILDCDSFQLSVDGRPDPSDLGTPIWTPPELQGVSLSSVVRTPNHDAFGLAQLLFLILFAGRYPFAGRPVGSHALSPEEAIRKFAFAFDPSPRVRMQEAPPGAPPFEMLPPNVARLFLRAFREGSELEGARPSAQEWVEALQGFEAGLGRCKIWRAHVHWGGAAECPWCTVLALSGFEVFPGPPGSAPDDGGDPEMAARLQKLVLEPVPLVYPRGNVIGEAVSSALMPGGQWWSKLTRPFAPINRLLLQGKLRELREAVASASVEAEAFQKKSAELFMSYSAAARPLQQQALEVGKRLQNLAGFGAEVLKRYQLHRREIELQKYLEGFLLRRYEIRGVGPGRKATLLSNNITTAADVRAAAISCLPGFGQPLVERLLQWRRDCEKGFRFQPAAPVPESLRRKIADDVGREAVVLRQRGVTLEMKFSQNKALYSRDVKALQAAYEDFLKKRAVAEAQLRFMEQGPP